MIKPRNTIFATRVHKANRWSEPQIILISFLAILIPSALLLMIPAGSVTGLSFIDALFTATSAISVTGLGVVDVGSHFTLMGHILLMLLMQIGGLGQMTMSVLLLSMLKARIGLRQQVLAKEALGQSTNIDVVKLVRNIVVFSCAIELVGMLLLAFRWVPMLGWEKGLFYSLFHAISAFNNAGFSLFRNNLIGYEADALVNLTIAGLFILGGLGFTVIIDLCRTRRLSRLQLHSKLMLVTTPMLLVVGTLLLFLLEYNNPATLNDQGVGVQLLAAFFQSASARTAGFNTLDIGHLTHASLLVMMVLMFIGAGSTSTGGGSKVTTFAIANLATHAFLTKKNSLSVFQRTISQQMIFKSLAIIVVSTMVLVIAMFALMVTEQKPFIEVMFETVSAFGTVGLSMGVTDHLTSAGKVILIVVMIIGRLGPLTLAFMLTRPHESKLAYPEGEVYTG